MTVESVSEKAIEASTNMEVEDVEAGYCKGTKKSSEMVTKHMRLIFAGLCLAGYLCWALSDALVQTNPKIKYMFMEPISKVYVEIGRPLAKLLLPTIVTPDSISFFHLFLALISALLVSSTNWRYRRIGAFIYMIRSLLDSTDGALARLRAAEVGISIHNNHIVDLDFAMDTMGAILYGIATLLYFKRAGITHPKGSIFFFGMAVTTVFLKGFMMDFIVELYENQGIEPSWFVCFLWKISSYDSWDNLKLFALFFMVEYGFYEFTGFFGVVWVGIPTLVSFAEIYYANS